MHLTLLLGGNQGNTIELLQLAENELRNRIGHVIDKSSYYETEAWGFEAEQNFINQIIVCDTNLAPTDALDIILDIEHELGRIRIQSDQRYSSRTMDIDILYCDKLIINTERLIVPHPRLHQRRFALVPLCEVAPDQVHPVFLKTNKNLLDECVDTLKVELVR